MSSTSAGAPESIDRRKAAHARTARLTDPSGSDTVLSAAIATVPRSKSEHMTSARNPSLVIGRPPCGDPVTASGAAHVTAVTRPVLGSLAPADGEPGSGRAC